jgi:hypothetical protein
MVYTFEHLGGAQMPWNECKPMDERLRFIARLLEGEVDPLECAHFGAIMRIIALNVGHF